MRAGSASRNRRPVLRAMAAHGSVWKATSALAIHNMRSDRSVVGDGAVDVMMATHSGRVRLAHIALESIARGTVRPRRLILWLDGLTLAEAITPSLNRLHGRGLEILSSQKLGPYAKQIPYAFGEADGYTPFVTADDDVIYPERWLETLIGGYQARPEFVHAHRAHRITRLDHRVAPYSCWAPEDSTQATFATFVTGVSGIIYPPTMSNALRDAGRKFLEVAPTADDIWVNSVAVHAGIRSAQISSIPQDYKSIPGSSRSSLYRRNVLEGANDDQFLAVYGPEVLPQVLQDARRLVATSC